MMKDPELPEKPEETQRIPVPPEVQSEPDPDIPEPNDLEYEEIYEAVEPAPRDVPVHRGETPERAWATSLDRDPAPFLTARNSALDRVNEEGTGLTVGDGFRFGCGFALAMAIGVLALLIVVTLFFAVGTLVGFKPPF